MYANNNKDTQYTKCLDLRKGKTHPVIVIKGLFINHEKAKVVLFMIILVCYCAVENILHYHFYRGIIGPLL